MSDSEMRCARLRSGRFLAKTTGSLAISFWFCIENTCTKAVLDQRQRKNGIHSFTQERFWSQFSDWSKIPNNRIA